MLRRPGPTKERVDLTILSIIAIEIWPGSLFSCSYEFYVICAVITSPRGLRPGVSNARPARAFFLRPAMLFGNFQVINIYFAKCFEKTCLEIIESKLNDTQCGLRHGRSTTDHISLSRKILRNLPMLKTSPLTPTRATIVALGFLVITRQLLQLERCSNPLRIQQV